MAGISGFLRLRAETTPEGRTVLREQAFRAPFHLSKPYWDPDARALLVQVVNPTAGILDGDELSSDISVGPEAALVVTTPSATRVFQMREGGAGSRQTFAVASRGWLEVMPEPLVPHRGSRFRQTTTIDAAADASVCYVDQLMPGRLGHGEAWSWDTLQLEMTVRVDGELVLRERLDQGGTGLRALAEAGGSGTNACFANLVLISPESAGPDPDLFRQLHSLQDESFLIGVSPLHRQGWSIKCVARDPIRLRDALRSTRALLARRFQRLSLDLRKL
ncbi:MAG: Urease accessory protein UreD [Verrucomicrobiota bacterium]|jgi:urease accessory protein